MKFDRVVIIHNHFFKNAGTSIDFALKKNFGDGFIDHRDDSDMLQGAEYLGPYLFQNPDIKALSTHHLTLPLPSLERVFLPMIMMLRHPVERLTSVYHFERQQLQSDNPGAKFARNHTRAEYIQWRIGQNHTSTVKNFYTYRIIPKRNFKNFPYGAQDFKMAETFIKNVPLLGVVDLFDESMVLFEEVLKEYFPNIDLSYVAQNVRQEAQSIDERLKELKVEIGEKLYDEFEKCNQDDMVLYETAKSHVKKTIQPEKEFKAKLKDFQARCAALKTGGRWWWIKT